MKERVVLLGAGNSLNEGIEKDLWNKIKSEEIWSCNYAFMTMPYLPKREIWVDITFFRNNIDKLENLSKQGVICCTKHHAHYNNIPNIHQYGSTRESKNYKGRDGIKDNSIYYGRMGLSGMFALGLAIAEGYKDIFLLGYDFGNLDINNKQTHYYQNKITVQSTGVSHPEVYRMKDNAVKKEVEDFKIYLQTIDVKIWNVSINSNIPYFEKISYEELFKKM